jgi:beta,beta-carotene 9',10'-dioxygenase
MVASTQPNYVQPGFRQNMDERHIENLPIKGVIPDWLEGSLIRNGPGMVNVDKPMRHWFDGLAMLHRFSFSGGKVDYRSKFVDCQAYRDVKKYGKITYSDFATDPCRSLFQKVQVVFENPPKITDSAKVNVDQIGDKAFALGEPLMQIQFDPHTLDSLGVFHYEKKTGNRMNTAHPHTDGHDAFNLVVEYGPINYYKIYSIADGVEEVASVPVLEPGYLHSFGMSENYFIIAEYPLLVQSLKLLFRQRPFIENFNWKPNKGTRFLVIDRATGKLKTTIKTEALFSFHHVNAFEKEGKLMVDLVSYSDASIIDQYYINRLESKDLQLPFGRLERFVLDLEKGSLQERKTLSGACIELPHFDYANYHGNHDYRYVYGCGINPEKRNEFYNQLVKIDVQTGVLTTWYHPGCFPGEAVFIPAPDRQTEDHGVLLSVVLDADQRNSFLLLLDARNLKEIGRAELPHAMLFGYHGKFFSRKEV